MVEGGGDSVKLYCPTKQKSCTYVSVFPGFIIFENCCAFVDYSLRDILNNSSGIIKYVFLFV